MNDDNYSGSSSSTNKSPPTSLTMSEEGAVDEIQALASQEPSCQISSMGSDSRSSCLVSRLEI